MAGRRPSVRGSTPSPNVTRVSLREFHSTWSAGASWTRYDRPTRVNAPPGRILSQSFNRRRKSTSRGGHSVRMFTHAVHLPVRSWSPRSQGFPREAAERPVPAYVEDELRGYLECGLLCFGFARSLCMACRTGFVVAFSCKGRGVCPSCNGRHMAQTAAHLADHVIPPVPVRQWVISVPKRLRGFLADRSPGVAALTKIFLDEIERLLCAVAGVTSDAATPASARPRLGGISFLHRFGSALNRHVHLRACVTDGVFVPAAADAGCDAPPAFLPARPITQADLAALTERVRRRVIRWFRRAGLLDAAAAADRLAWENSGFSVDATCPDHAHRPRCAQLFSESRTPVAVLRPAPLREAPASISRGVRPESQAQAHRHGSGHRQRRQPARGGCRRAWIAFITEPGPIRKILSHLGEPPLDGRHDQSRRSRTVHQPEDRCGRAIGRAIVSAPTHSAPFTL